MLETAPINLADVWSVLVFPLFRFALRWVSFHSSLSRGLQIILCNFLCCMSPIMKISRYNLSAYLYAAHVFYDYPFMYTVKN